MKTSELKRLAHAATNAGYNEPIKAEFHKLGRKLLRELASLTSLGSADIRSNQAGIAVAGEIILHTDVVYVQVTGTDLGILYRTVSGRRDYTGGHNNWYSWQRLAEHGVAGLAAAVEQLVARNTSAPTYADTVDAARRLAKLVGKS